MANIVILNVGGSIFQTSITTLTKFDGFFRTMFETGNPVAKDECGAIFIDRDPKHFRLILNFMRDGDVDLQKYLEDITEIQKEAEFFLLLGLVELCKKRQTTEDEPNNKKREFEYPNKFCYINTDEELLDLTFMPKNPIIVFFGPIEGGTTSYPHDVNLLEFQKQYASKIDFYIRLFASSDDSPYWHYEGYANGQKFTGNMGHPMYRTDLKNAVIQMVSPQNG